MNSEIEQLKKEIEQLKEENRKLYKEKAELERRYVPDDKNSQSTFIIEIEEDSDNYIIKTRCTTDPMWDKKNAMRFINDDDNICYVKYLPCADVFDYKTRDRFNKMTLEYGGHKCSDHKYIIPKSSCEREFLMDDIFGLLWHTKFELGWLSKYE